MASFFIGIIVVFLLGMGVLYIFERRLLHGNYIERIIIIFGTGIMVLSTFFAIIMVIV